MRLVFLGPPGVGKGTQAQKVSERLAVPHISTGDMLRESVAQGTELGKAAKSFMDRGELVPDEVIIGLVKERIQKADCVNGFILDGFPRTVPQAEALDKALEELSIKLDGTISFEVSEEELVKRLGGRRTCPTCQATFHVSFKPPKQDSVCDGCGGALITRDDDQPDAIRRRLQVYQEKTAPLIQYYEKQDLLKTIDASPAPDSVLEAVIKVVSA